MIRGSSSDFIGHPLPKDSISDPHMGPPTTPGPRAPHHLNPALLLSVVCAWGLLLESRAESRWWVVLVWIHLFFSFALRRSTRSYTRSNLYSWKESPQQTVAAQHKSGMMNSLTAKHVRRKTKKTAQYVRDRNGKQGSHKYNSKNPQNSAKNPYFI